MTTITTGIDKNLSNVRCANSHSGNTTLHPAGKYYECAGCGSFYSVEQIRKATVKPHGAGGLRLVEAR